MKEDATYVIHKSSNSVNEKNCTKTEICHHEVIKKVRTVNNCKKIEKNKYIWSGSICTYKKEYTTTQEYCYSGDKLIPKGKITRPDKEEKTCEKIENQTSLTYLKKGETILIDSYKKSCSQLKSISITTSDCPCINCAIDPNCHKGGSSNP